MNTLHLRPDDKRKRIAGNIVVNKKKAPNLQRMLKAGAFNMQDACSLPLKSQFTAYEKAFMKDAPTYHSNCLNAAEVARPGKTERDRIRKYGYKRTKK